MKKPMERTLNTSEFKVQADDSLIICRCEEITKGEIRRALYDGMRTMNEIKRFLRVGMGLCQGQTCNRLVKGIIARELGIALQDLEVSKPRSPVRPIAMKIYANDGLVK
jgi:NAD(P)H-nitrite reductase large subunit